MRLACEAARLTEQGGLITDERTSRLYTEKEIGAPIQRASEIQEREQDEPERGLSFQERHLGRGDRWRRSRWGGTVRSREWLDLVGGCVGGLGAARTAVGYWTRSQRAELKKVSEWLYNLLSEPEAGENEQTRA